MMTPEQYMTERVDNQIEWFGKKSAKAKKWYICLQIAELLLSVSIPFIANFISDTTVIVKHLVSLFGISIAAITGMLVLMKYKENWTEYRIASELLKHEKFMYLTQCGAYAHYDRFHIFVHTIEGILSREIADWRMNRTPQQETPQREEEKEPTKA